MKIIKPENSDELLKSQIGEVRNSDDAIEYFLRFFKENKLKEIQEHEEEDMLLFQYGSYDWKDGNGREFSFDLTRQFEVSTEDEFLQLGLTLYYDADQFEGIKSFNSWSIESVDLNEWEYLIRQTEGYDKTRGIQPERFEIGLAWT